MALTAQGSAEPVPGDPVIPDEPDLREPLFFASHANVHGSGRIGRSAQPDRAFLEFFTDLSVNMSHLHFRRSGADPGFMDLTMRSGRDWEREILRAVGSCQVFVALLSNPYSNSPWCGREWHAFTRRRCWSRATRERTETNECVIPVIWAAPLRESAIPATVNAVERFIPAPLSDPTTAALYQERGLFGLRSTSHDAYTAAVWWLAREVEDKLQEYWVEPEIPASHHVLTDLFSAGAA